MITHFICLANSFKEGGLCMGGIEVDYNDIDNSYSIKRDENGNPIWIRPVLNANGDALPYQLNYIRKADLLEINIRERCPKYAHSENVTFSRIKHIKVVELSLDELCHICTNNFPTLFYNRGKAVPVEVFKVSKCSLALIKPVNPEFTLQTAKYDNHAHIKVSFIYNNIPYRDISVTDPAFIDKIKEDSKLLSDYNHRVDLFFTVSLGEVFKEFHYKIVAGIIEP